MKTYKLLSSSTSQTAVAAALDELLTRDGDMWVLKNPKKEIVAYFSLSNSSHSAEVRTVRADIGGWHRDQSHEFVAVLDRLREKIGGKIEV